MGLSTTFSRLPLTTREIVKSKPQVDGLLVFKKDPHGRPMRVKRSRWAVFVAERLWDMSKGAVPLTHWLVQADWVVGVGVEDLDAVLCDQG